MNIDHKFINNGTREFFARGIRRKIIVYALFVLLVYIYYALLYPQMGISVDNYIIFCSSLMIVCYGLYDVFKYGARISNGFLISWFFFLTMNNLNISRLQIHKSYTDFYYLFSGAIVLFFIVKFFDSAKKKTIFVKQKISPDTIVNCLLIITIVLKLTIFFFKGSPLLAGHWGTGRGTLFQIGGVSGLSTITMWLSLFLLPEIRKRKRIFVILMAVLFEGIFALSRNNLMMIVCYLICLNLLKEKGYTILSKTFFQRIAMLVIATVVIFMILGNFRQEQRGWTDVDRTIKTLLESNSDNLYLNWFYGYTAINYDVMLQIMTRAEHPMTAYAIADPLVRAFCGYEGAVDYREAVFHTRGLNGFNASTIFGPMIYEMGYLYIIQVVILGIQVGGLGYIARTQNSKGHYAYLMSFAVLSIFGNFYSIPIYFFVSVSDIIMHATIVGGRWDGA